MEVQKLIKEQKFSFIPSFQALVKKVQEDRIFQDIIDCAEKHYDIKCFKFTSSFTPQIAQSVWSELHAKRLSDLQPSRPCNWQQNQRRLFVWYAICFCFYQKLLLSQLKEKHYIQLSQMFFHKEPIFLQYQCQILIKKNSKCTWSPQQDKILIELIEDHTSGKWNQIAKEMFFRSKKKLFRTPKQCRERWFNHLDKSKVKGDWDLSQDYKILKYVKESGKRWAKIIPILGNVRTQHMIKNRFKSIISKNGNKNHQSQKQIIEKTIEIIEAQLKAEDQSNSTTPNINSHFQTQCLFEEDIQKIKKETSSSSTISFNSNVFELQNNRLNQFEEESESLKQNNDCTKDFLSYFNIFNTLIINQNSISLYNQAPILKKTQSFKPFNSESIFDINFENEKIKEFDATKKSDSKINIQRQIRLIQLNI